MRDYLPKRFQLNSLALNAAALGAKVITTSSSDENLQIVKGLGAMAGINYRTSPDWHEDVLKLTDGKGVDLLLDVAVARASISLLRLPRQLAVLHRSVSWRGRTSN